MRLLGYDTVVYSKEAGREMLRQADAEGRIVLTRRRDMVGRQFSGILFLVTDVIVSKQLKAVIEKYFLKVDREKMFSICLECNRKLHSIEKMKSVIWCRNMFLKIVTDIISARVVVRFIGWEHIREML